jgi:hypothetical protein
LTRRALGGLLVLGLCLLVVHVVLASRFGEDEDTWIMRDAWIEVVIYALAVFVALRDKGQDVVASRRATAFILGLGVVLRIVLIPIDPVSTDINRYIWDGRVQAAGINPYLYIPADPALADLRDDEIYPEINRKSYAHTIYPPFAEIVFYLVTRIDESVITMKAAMVGFELVAIWAIVRLLRARGLPPTRILLYAWHPLPIWEFAGSGHVDAIALACVLLALLAADARRPILAGIALGGAALTKYFPVIVGPAVYRRWDWKLPLAGALTVAALYLPYIGAGTKVFGFLSGYGDEEGFHDGSGLYPIVFARHVLPSLPQIVVTLYLPFAALVLAGLGLVVLFRRRERGADLGGAFLLACAFTVLTSPHFPWYLAWLVPFLCFMPSWPVIWLTGTATLMYIAGWPPSFLAGSFFYLPFLALLGLDVTLRRLGTKDGPYGNPVAL